MDPAAKVPEPRAGRARTGTCQRSTSVASLGPLTPSLRAVGSKEG